MVDNYAYVEAARFIACCFGVGAVLGLLVALIKGERHGEDDRS